jgi:Flp pilus assembly CpaE family ATPase
MTMFQDPEEIVRIRVTRKTREELKRCGIKGESYELILQRLTKQWFEDEKRRGIT